MSSYFCWRRGPSVFSCTGRFRAITREMASWQARQSGLADDQAQRLSDWLKERQGDARVLSNTASSRNILRSPAASASTSRDSLESLDDLAKYYIYAGVYILDREGRVVEQSTRSVSLDTSFSGSCRAVATSGTPLLTLVGDSPSRSQMGFIFPIFAESAANGSSPHSKEAVGEVLLVSDAAKTLFPLVTRDVVPTHTGETLLVRRDGNDVVIFSPAHGSSAIPGVAISPADGAEG